MPPCSPCQDCFGQLTRLKCQQGAGRLTSVVKQHGGLSVGGLPACRYPSAVMCSSLNSELTLAPHYDGGRGHAAPPPSQTLAAFHAQEFQHLRSLQRAIPLTLPLRCVVTFS